jgi:hypothetical protein
MAAAGSSSPGSTDRALSFADGEASSPSSESDTEDGVGSADGENDASRERLGMARKRWML